MTSHHHRSTSGRVLKALWQQCSLCDDLPLCPTGLRYLLAKELKMSGQNNPASLARCWPRLHCDMLSEACRRLHATVPSGTKLQHAQQCLHCTSPLISLAQTPCFPVLLLHLSFALPFFLFFFFCRINRRMIPCTIIPQACSASMCHSNMASLCCCAGPQTCLSGPRTAAPSSPTWCATASSELPILGRYPLARRGLWRAMTLMLQLLARCPAQTTTIAAAQMQMLAMMQAERG